MVFNYNIYIYKNKNKISIILLITKLNIFVWLLFFICNIKYDIIKIFKLISKNLKKYRK